jgi:kumamolisin
MAPGGRQSELISTSHDPPTSMRQSARWSVRTRRGFGLALVALLVGCVMAIPAGSLPGASVSGGAPHPLASEAAVAPIASEFAVRAGYSLTQVSEARHIAPAAEPQTVEVTFEPTNAAFYAAPAPGSAPMTSAEVGAEFGLSIPAYSAAERYFETEGLTVTHAWPDRLSLTLTGSVAALDRAFDTSILTGNYEGRMVSFPGTPPSLPPDLEPEVQSVAGLSSGFDRFSLPDLPEPSLPAGTASPAQNPNNLITPPIARDIYQISGLYNLTSSPTYATGKGIVLLLWGAGYAPSDLQTFFSQYYPTSFPAPKVTAYPVDGAPAPSANAVNDPSNGSRELTLDLEWSGSAAPGATLDAVYAPAGPSSDNYSPSDSSMIDALNLAVDTSSLPGVATISMSFGSADGADPTLTSGFESDFAVAAHEGITLFAATGDNGGDAGAGCTGGVDPEYPSASPQVVAVGGTTVSLDRGVLGAITGFSESAWDDSGGGFSTQFPAPSWQEVGSAAGPIEANGHRGMPDVSATADYNFLYFDGAQDAGAGTSFAAPLWAGMVTEMDALHGTNFGFLDPVLYELGANASTSDQPFNDITTGANCLGAAGPGWDTATGWGSPVGVFLYEHIVSSIVNLAVSASPSPVAPGGTVTIRVTVTNSTSGAPISGVSVLVSLGSTGLGGPCSGNFGSVTPVSNATGAVVAQISIPVCYLGSGASASVTVSSDGYFGSGGASVNVNLLGLDPALAPLSGYPTNVVLFVGIMAAGIVVGAWLGRPRDRRTEEPAIVAPPAPVEPPSPATFTTADPPVPPESPAESVPPEPSTETVAPESPI